MRLPPLNAIRAFEAAARLGGFVKAAGELHVTPAAVSHQVKSLEAHLGVKLFNRQHRGLELTTAGLELLPEVSRGLAHFSRAVGALSGGELAGRLTVNAAPSLATLWLVPRLGSFSQAYPDIKVRILANEVAPDLNLGKVDIRIPYGSGQFPGFKSRLLMRDGVFPVCSPSLLNNRPLRRFSDLRDHILLHDIDTDVDEPTMTWARWLRDSGLTMDAPSGHVEFGNSVLLTEAAVRGQGVALGRTSLVRDHLETGRLVRPLKTSRTGDYAYYLVTTVADAERPRVKVFLDWIERQVEAEILE
ncbi:MAG: transcriptional regulator GcvA [Alphaproteobacteria bacterium]|nr:transcriptional regulator GcvA [Alphaproteobacteria bacterium]